jgi:hypothetical protein
MGRLLNSNESGSEKPKNDWGSLIEKWGITELIPEERLLEILGGTGLGQKEPHKLSGDTKD